MKVGETTLKVRYQETDQMGVVYHANYLVWMEVGRGEYFEEKGIPYTMIEENKIFLPIIKVCCHYKSPAFYADTIKIVTSLISLRTVKITFRYEMFNQKGDLLATGETEQAFVNDSGKPVALKKQNPFLWEKLLEALQKEEGA